MRLWEIIKCRKKYKDNKRSPMIKPRNTSTFRDPVDESAKETWGNDYKDREKIR